MAVGLENPVEINVITHWLRSSCRGTLWMCEHLCDAGVLQNLRREHDSANCGNSVTDDSHSSCRCEDTEVLTAR